MKWKGLEVLGENWRKRNRRLRPGTYEWLESARSVRRSRFAKQVDEPRHRAENCRLRRARRHVRQATQNSPMAIGESRRCLGPMLQPESLRVPGSTGCGATGGAAAVSASSSPAAATSPATAAGSSSSPGAGSPASAGISLLKQPAAARGWGAAAAASSSFSPASGAAVFPGVGRRRARSAHWK